MRIVDKRAQLRRLKVKIYLPKYDTQGEEQTIPDTVVDKRSWEKFKQTAIRDFVDDFKVHFKQRGFVSPQTKQRIKGFDFDNFGKGVYANNEMNRRLGRVGMSYDKGAKLREVMTDAVRMRNVEVENEAEIMGLVMHGIKWKRLEVNALKRLRIKGLKAKQIAKRLGRTVKAQYNLVYRLKKKKLW